MHGTYCWARHKNRVIRKVILPILMNLPSWLWAFGALQMVIYHFVRKNSNLKDAWGQPIIALPKGLWELGTFFDGVECGPCPSF
jgi:hypothetical protein